MNLFNSISNSASKAVSRVKYNTNKFMLNNPSLVKPTAIAGIAAAMASNSVLAAGFDASGGVATMTSYVCSILMGVGVIYGLIAVFNWVSAVKQEDAERQSKSIVNVFIAGLLIVIKPISVAIITAFGGKDAAGMIGD